MDVGGPVLGILSGATYQQASSAIDPEDVLVLYSDGLVEATNSAGEEYGEARLQELLMATHTKSEHEIRQAILGSVGAFLGTAVAHDDLTCVIAKFGGNQS